MNPVMVERVAKAMKTWTFAKSPMLNGYRICGVIRDGDSVHFPWEVFPTAAEAHAELDRRNARAVIAAMREPTEAMMEGMMKSASRVAAANYDQCAATWAGAIDAALQQDKDNG